LNPIINTVSYQETGYFTKIIHDYLDRSPFLKSFYGNFPVIEQFQMQLEQKKASYAPETRRLLAAQVEKQNEAIITTAATGENIHLLTNENTFTVVTGHQLNLNTGPLYFLYKIISTINLCKQLKGAYPKNDFVPVFWMASEDHDFDEVNFFNYRDKKITWNTIASGPVGRLGTSTLEKVGFEYAQLLGKSKNAGYLKDLFSESYLKHSNLAGATRFLVNELFGSYGLVIIDGDDAVLKQEFSPYMKHDLLKQTCYHEVNRSTEVLSEKYKGQVNPREINLFYIMDGLRERIIFEDGLYKINNTAIQFTWSEIEAELNDHPDRFSPNVMMRPLYQEVVLPNLCYIGGGGELAYWFQLKGFFDSQGVPFPVLLLRNSALILSQKQARSVEKLSISRQDFFTKKEELIREMVTRRSEIVINLDKQRQQVQDMFAELEALSDQTDPSFSGAVRAERKRQLNGIDKLEKRLLKAQKRKMGDLVSRLELLKDALFPQGALQERTANFSDFYEAYGSSFIQGLVDQLNPLELKFSVLAY